MRKDEGTEHDLRFGDVGTIVTTERFVERTTLPTRNEERRGRVDRGVLGNLDLLKSQRTKLTTAFILRICSAESALAELTTQGELLAEALA
jgi:hypothetical protein